MIVKAVRWRWRATALPVKTVLFMISSSMNRSPSRLTMRLGWRIVSLIVL